MQFSDTTKNQGLIEDVDFLARSTSASYPVNDKTRNINQAYHDVTRLIWESADDWEYDDSNATDLPKVLRTMGHASASYQIPTTAQRIERVEIQDDDNDWVKLKPLDHRDITVALDEYLDDPHRPIYYDLEGNYLTLYPAPHSAYTTLSSGLALRVARDVTEFPTTATTTKPGFATQFHRYLSVSAALDFTEDAGRRNFLLEMKERMRKGIQNFYSSRMIEKKPQMRPYGKRRWRQYL